MSSTRDVEPGTKTKRASKAEQGSTKCSEKNRVHPLTQLQRTHGNQAVKQLIEQGLRPKLKVGQPNDEYEREADAVAEAVTAGRPAPAVSRVPAGKFGDDVARQRVKDERSAEATSTSRKSEKQAPAPTRTVQQRATEDGKAEETEEEDESGLSRPLQPVLRTGSVRRNERKGNEPLAVAKTTRANDREVERTRRASRTTRATYRNGQRHDGPRTQH